MAKESPNGWDRWQNLVLSDMQRLSAEMQAMRQEQNCMGKQLAALRVKSGLWGAMGACVPIALLLLTNWARG